MLNDVGYMPFLCAGCLKHKKLYDPRFYGRHGWESDTLALVYYCFSCLKKEYPDHVKNRITGDKTK